MATITDELEDEVAALRALQASGLGGPRIRAARDAHFAALLRLIAPRARRLIRQYGLGEHYEDAEQACAIGAYRAVELYDPSRARFSCFVTWQLRGELQALRHRVRCDARDASNQLCPVRALAAADLLERVEEGAARRMARRAGEAMLDDYLGQLRAIGMRHIAGRCRPETAERARLEARLKRERTIVERLLFGEDEPAARMSLPVRSRREPGAERLRTIGRRALCGLASHVRGNPRFDPDPIG